MESEKSKPKRSVDPYKKVLDWFWEEIRAGNLSVGDTRTIQQIKSAGEFGFAAVKKALDELEKIGVVQNTRSVGARIVGLGPSNWKRRGHFSIGVIAAPSAKMLDESLEGFRSKLEEISARHNLGVPTLLSIWKEWAGTEDGLQPLSAALDGCLVLPGSTTDESSQLGRLAAQINLPSIAIHLPGDPFPHLLGPSIDTFEGGRLAARHLLLQLNAFRERQGGSEPVLLPPVFVFGDNPPQQSRDAIRGVQDELLDFEAIKKEVADFKGVDFFFNPTDQLWYPGDVRTSQWAPEVMRLKEGWKGPKLNGEAAGRFFGTQLAIELTGRVAATPGPKCGVICMNVSVAKGAIQAFEHAGVAVGKEIFVVAIDNEGRQAGSFLSRVRADYRRLGALAAEQLLSRLISPSSEAPASVAVKPVVQARRSSSSFLHKLWRSNPGPTVIKDLETKLQYANPMFEEVIGRSTAVLKNRTPRECWGEAVGGVIEKHDLLIRKTCRPHISCEWLPYHACGSKRFTFRFPVYLKGVFCYIGTLGFDYMDVGIGKARRVTMNPSNEQATLRDDPPDDVIAAFFECLPCSVLVRSGSKTILYANNLFADLSLESLSSARLVGTMPPPLREHFDFLESPDEHTLLFTEDQLPCCAFKNLVVRFPLLDSFYRKAADASMGFDASVLQAVNTLVAGIETTKPYADAIIPLEGPQHRRGYFVAGIDEERGGAGLDRS